MHLKSRSLKNRLLLSLFVVAVIVFFLTEFIFIEKERRSLVKMLERNAAAHASSLVTLTFAEPDAKVELDSIGESVKTLKERHTSAYFLVLRLSDHMEIERSESLRDVNFSLPIAPQEFPRGRTYFWKAQIKGKQVRFAAVRASVPSGDNECLFIAGLSQEYISVRLRETLEITAPILAVELAIMLALSWVVIHRGVAPLHILEREVQTISSSNLTPVSIPEISEFAGVAKTLNAIIGNLKESFERERRFTANVAHELRTRVSEIRSVSEVALRYADNMDEHDRKNYEEILQSTKEMQETVLNLLTLARCHSGQLSPKKENIQLQPLISSVWSKQAHEAAVREIIAAGEIPKDLIIATDRNLLETILDNLFSNAVSYTARKGKIEWLASKHGDEFSFSVSNSVHDLSEDDLRYIFEPFWRKNKARTSDDNHSGLGLSLIQSLAEVLDMTVSACLTTPTFLTITLSGKTRPV